MCAFRPIPLGRAIPQSPHAVSCSLPRMRDVRGYEEKNPGVMRRLASGYPRFVVHPFARKLAAHLAAESGLTGRALWLTSSAAMAGQLAARIGGDGTAFQRHGIHGVAHSDSAETAARAKLFLQNVGGFLSSREAEDCLVRLGLAEAAYPEEAHGAGAEEEVRRHLRKVIPGTADADLFLAGSGMSALYAAFRALSELQSDRGRTIWVQLGWLYLDTICILKKLTGTPADYAHVRDVVDLGGLRRLIAERGPHIAGVVAEIPTNPLVQTPDVPELAELCRKNGIRLVLDPSTSSVFSVDALRHSDVLVSSLTKYAANEGDVLAGMAAVNPSGEDADRLRRRLPELLEPLYPRDLARLASEIGRAEAVLKRIEANAPKVAEFLRSHPKVRDVHWALHPASERNYSAIARAPGATGGMITFTLLTPMEPFYDRLTLPKGPSFGMKNTLICPFLYLAHYDLVTTPAGRAELAANGLDPELLRLCVGAEPAEEIIEALADALD